MQKARSIGHDTAENTEIDILTLSQVTGADSRIGINRQDGIVYFLHRRSSEKGAEILWDNPSPDPAALPKLRPNSDLAFGL